MVGGADQSERFWAAACCGATAAYARRRLRLQRTAVLGTLLGNREAPRAPGGPAQHRRRRGRSHQELLRLRSVHAQTNPADLGLV